MSRRLPDGRELDIKRTQQGLSLAEIAAQYGVTRQAVHKAHLRWQMRSLPPGADLDRLIHGEEGWTWEALAIQYGSTPDLVEQKHRMWEQRRRQRERQRQAS